MPILLIVLSLSLLTLPQFVRSNECVLINARDPHGCLFGLRLADFTVKFTCDNLELTLQCLSEKKYKTDCAENYKHARSLHKHWCTDSAKTMQHRFCLDKNEDTLCKRDWEQKMDYLLAELMAKNISAGVARDLQIDICKTATYVCVEKGSADDCLRDAIAFRKKSGAKFVGAAYGFKCVEFPNRGGGAAALRQAGCIVALLNALLIMRRALQVQV